MNSDAFHSPLCLALKHVDLEIVVMPNHTNERENRFRRQVWIFVYLASKSSNKK